MYIGINGKKLSIYKGKNKKFQFIFYFIRFLKLIFNRSNLFISVI